MIELEINNFLLILCRHLYLLHRDRVVEIGRLSAKTIRATHYLKFSVKITTNQLHYYFRKKVPFLGKEVSRMILINEEDNI